VTCAVRANANCANKKRPSEYFKRELLVDTIVLSEEGLRHLVAELGVGQIVYGTDIPFNWARHRRSGAQGALLERRRQGSDPRREPDASAADRGVEAVTA
jgi:hypothetical protein